MRSPLWFVVAGVVALAGFAATGLYMVPRFKALEALMTRVVVPGSATLTFDKPGSYTIYHEQSGFVDGRYYASELAAGLQVRLLDTATGTSVKLASSTGSSYSMGDHKGTSILAFTIDHPGQYEFGASLPGERTEPKAVLTVDRGMVTAMIKLVFGGIAIAFGGLAVGGVIAAFALWQRSKTPAKT